MKDIIDTLYEERETIALILMSLGAMLIFSFIC